jgi:hypothetical protein
MRLGILKLNHKLDMMHINYVEKEGGKMVVFSLTPQQWNEMEKKSQPARHMTEQERKNLQEFYKSIIK